MSLLKLWMKPAKPVTSRSTRIALLGAPYSKDMGAGGVLSLVMAMGLPSEKVK